MFRQSGTLPWYGMEYALDDFLVYIYYGHKREHSAQIAAFRDLPEQGSSHDQRACSDSNDGRGGQATGRGPRQARCRSLMALITDDCVFENTYPSPDGHRYEGQKAIRAFGEDFFHTTPHADFQTEDLFAAGNRCVARWVYHWSNTLVRTGIFVA